MSKISDYADAVKASFDAVNASVDGIAADLADLAKKIEELQNSAGQVTPEVIKRAWTKSKAWQTP